MACCVVVVTAAIWTDVEARTRTRTEESALAAVRARLAHLRQEVAAATGRKAATTAKRDTLSAYLAVTLGQLATTNASLGSTQVHEYLQGVDISTLQACLGGVQRALSAIKASDSASAAKDIAAVSGPCAQLTGGSSSGLVYPFDFPDPSMLVVGDIYYAYATNSVAGNIQIVASNDLTHWTAVNNALPGLPSWASAHFTWAPSVARIGGTFDMYYAVDPAGSTNECISVATAAQPQGPFVDGSSAPLECQNSLGGSIDPAAFVDSHGTPYLLWKSGGTGSSKIWSQQLSPSGTSFAPGTSPTVVLTPDAAWEGGTVEAPDLVEAGGRYDLFFSGNDWNTGDYAVGAATCSGPLGPCTDSSSNPVLASDPGVSGPGGESVFADTSGSFHIAFHGWVPGAVRFPNTRGLYIRRIDLSGAVPAVGGAG